MRVETALKRIVYQHYPRDKQECGLICCQKCQKKAQKVSVDAKINPYESFLVFKSAHCLNQCAAPGCPKPRP